MKSRFLLSTAALALVLGACGGGGDDDAVMAVNEAVPASALASARAFSAYATSVPADDGAEPLRLERVVPPVSETDEPIALR